MDTNKIKHIFFDLDNTLWDHRKNSEIVLKEMFKENEIFEKYDLTFEAWHEVFYEKNEYLWEKLRDGKITKQTLREERFRKPFLFFDLDLPELADYFEENYLKRMSTMKETVPGAKDLVEYLSHKYKLHVITNGFEEVSSQKIKNADIEEYIETLTCADEINVRKPDPRIFEYALNKANAKLEESVLIGDDWVADIIGATQFGMKTIFFDSLNEGKTLENVPVVKSLAEIKNLL